MTVTRIMFLRFIALVLCAAFVKFRLSVDLQLKRILRLLKADARGQGTLAFPTAGFSNS